MAKTLKNNFKKAFHSIKDTINDESVIHKEIQNLLGELDAIYDSQKSTLKMPTTTAFKSFRQETKDLLTADSKAALPHHPEVQFNLAKSFLNIVSKHQSKMELEPTFWNQLKGKINDFFDKCFGCGEILSVKNTSLGGKTEPSERGPVTVLTKAKLQFEEKLDELKSTDSPRP